MYLTFLMLTWSDCSPHLILSAKVEKKCTLLYFKLANILLFNVTVDMFRCYFMNKIISCHVF